METIKTKRGLKVLFSFDIYRKSNLQDMKFLKTFNVFVNENITKAEQIELERDAQEEIDRDSELEKDKEESEESNEKSDNK